MVASGRLVVILSNTLPEAKFMTGVVQYGSEPLYDNVTAATKHLSSLEIPVTIGELAFQWQEVGES